MGNIADKFEYLSAGEASLASESGFMTSTKTARGLFTLRNRLSFKNSEFYRNRLNKLKFFIVALFGFLFGFAFQYFSAGKTPQCTTQRRQPIAIHYFNSLIFIERSKCDSMNTTVDVFIDISTKFQSIAHPY